MWPLGALQQTNTYSVYLPWNHLIIQPAKIMVYDNTTRSQGWCAYHYPGLHQHRAVEQTKSPSNPVRVGKQDHNMETKGNYTRMCIYSWYLHCCSSASLILIIAAVIFQGTADHRDHCLIRKSSGPTAVRSIHIQRSHYARKVLRWLAEFSNPIDPAGPTVANWSHPPQNLFPKQVPLEWPQCNRGPTPPVKEKAESSHSSEGLILYSMGKIPQASPRIRKNRRSVGLPLLPEAYPATHTWPLVKRYNSLEQWAHSVKEEGNAHRCQKSTIRTERMPCQHHMYVIYNYWLRHTF